MDPKVQAEHWSRPQTMLPIIIIIIFFTFTFLQQRMRLGRNPTHRVSKWIGTSFPINDHIGKKRCNLGNSGAGTAVKLNSSKTKTFSPTSFWGKVCLQFIHSPLPIWYNARLRKRDGRLCSTGRKSAPQAQSSLEQYHFLKSHTSLSTEPCAKSRDVLIHN